MSSVGGSKGHELDATTVADADLYVEWLGAATSAPPAGAYELQGVASEVLTLLGTALAQPMDRHSERRTVFKSTGHASLDLAASAVVFRCALQHGTGSCVEMDVDLNALC